MNSEKNCAGLVRIYSCLHPWCLYCVHTCRRGSYILKIKSYMRQSACLENPAFICHFLAICVSFFASSFKCNIDLNFLGQETVSRDHCRFPPVAGHGCLACNASQAGYQPPAGTGTRLPMRAGHRFCLTSQLGRSSDF